MGETPLCITEEAPSSKECICPAVGMPARPALSDPALGERGTVSALFEDLPFLPLDESAVYKKGVTWYYVDKGEHETMKNISWLAEISIG